MWIPAGLALRAVAVLDRLSDGRFGGTKDASADLRRASLDAVREVADRERIRVGEVPVLHRVTQGVKLISLRDGELLQDIARVVVFLAREAPYISGQVIAVELGETEATEVLELIDKLEQDEDVQKVYHTLA